MPEKPHDHSTSSEDLPQKEVLDLDELSKQLNVKNDNVCPSFEKATEDFDSQLKPFRDLGDRMKSLVGIVGEGSALGKVAKQIADQQRTIDAIRPMVSANSFGYPLIKDVLDMPEPPRLAELRIPPNPIHETNQKLEAIEERFDQIQHIATDAAKIATGLQAAAAEFLQKFERAASDNDRTARRAIRIGLLALFIAITMPATQILYSEFRREPSNGSEIHAVLEQVKAELTALREAQASAADRVTEAAAVSDHQTAAILRDIATLLSRPPDRVVPEPGDAPN